MIILEKKLAVKATATTMEITQNKSYIVIEFKEMGQRHDGSKLHAVKVLDDNKCFYWASLGNEFILA